ncbi:hypothetical protein C8F04DRAFT_1175270 [Mycena alexandri]|uniref:Uncharacterized protein n=1 Tax=Mycena alexandri TaxID=1745969 RepID=A0AAD6TBN7_9AGAR|nr:hypothetical protein C8F04DRAFT_1175270 [Mycena alexandri]
MDNYDTKEAAAANVSANSVTVSEPGIPKAHKVLLRGKEGRREVVFTVIGAIINKAFLPVNSARREERFGRQLGSYDRRPWRDVEGDLPLLHDGNNIPAEAKVPFASNVDPQKVLEKLTSELCSHCEDNDIDYLEWKDEKLIRKNPVGFRVVDIIQVEILVCAFRASKTGNTPRYMCKLVLRSVTLPDISMARTSYLAETASPGEPLGSWKEEFQSSIQRQAFKRTRVQIESDSEDDELPSARQKMGKLMIKDVIMDGRKSAQ